MTRGRSISSVVRAGGRLLLGVMVVGILSLPAGASAAPLANFGSFGAPNGSQGGQLSPNARGVAANHSGNGAPAGSVYVAEAFPNHRISQFTGSGEFVRTWGFDVVDGVNHPGAPNDNGMGFEVCDVTAGNTADQCKEGVKGAEAGQLNDPMGIAVDQSNGYLYVTNTDTRRVDVFSGTGEFAGAFGYDVRPEDPDPSGPDFCTTATGCQAAADGGGDAGRFGAWNAGTASNPAVDPTEPGRVYVPDPGNLRVSHYETTVAGGVLTDVSFVKAFGSDVVASGPGNRTVSRDEQQSVALFGALVFGPQCPNGLFCVLPVTGGTFTLSFDPDGGGAAPAETTGPIPYDASAAVVEQRLVDDLGSVAGGDVSVSGGPGPDAAWIVDFGGAYAGVDVADLVADSSGLTPPGSSASVSTTSAGGQFPDGLEVCVPGDGDVCKEGISGNGPGEFTSFGSPSAVAVDSTGAIYATSGPLNGGTCSTETPCRIQKFSPDASTVSDFGPASDPGQLTFTSGASTEVAAINLAVNPANDHVFVLRKENTDSYRVLEYDSAGNHLDTHPAGPALPAGFQTVLTGVAVGTEGRVYVNYAFDGVSRAFILGPVDPPAVTIAPATAVGATSATFNGTVEIPPPGSPTLDTTYRFEYSKNGVDWTAVPVPDASVGDGSIGVHAVSETVTGLDPNTLYSVRLVATTGPTATSSAVSFTTGGASPRVALTFVDKVTQTSARLGGHVDPEGAKTTYRFEWGSQPCSTAPAACLSVPAFERQLGSDNQVLIANEPIDGLKPATTYHYRVVATNAAGTTTGPDQRFETLNDCNLTSGRCYELVSPPDKGVLGAGGDVVSLAQELVFQPARDKPAIAYTLAYGTSDSTAGDEALFKASRTASGWSSEQLEAPTVALRDSPGVTSNTSNAKGMSLNLDCGVFSSDQPLGDNPPSELLGAGSVALYSRSLAGTWTALTDIVPSNPHAAAAHGLVEFDLVGMSQDAPCARVVFTTAYEYPGVDGDGTPRLRLYWWENGVLGYVGVIPGPCAGGGCVVQAVPGAPLFTEATFISQSRNFHDAVSEDGSQVFFTAISQEGGDTGRQALFMRDLDSPVAVDVSQSQTGSLPGGTVNDDDAVYQMATADGSKVFFTGRYGLASNADGTAVESSTGADSCSQDTTGTPGDGRGCDLYEYDVASGKLSALSVPHPDVTTNTAGASVKGVLATDDDGSHVYLAARGKLAPGEGATEGRNLADDTLNVYLAHDGSFSYVGRIEEGGPQGQLVGQAHRAPGSTGYWSSRASGDGSRLLFESNVNVTDYDAGGRTQAYLYDAASATTVCVSCRRDGRAPTAITANDGDREPIVQPLAYSYYSRTSTAQPRSLSVDGRWAFFISYDDLATGATEGRPNLYQWEDGQVSFIASSAPNTSPRSLRFGGASADGDDLYFTSVDKYSWQDRDFRLDIYDARVGGGFAEPPPPPAPCDPMTDSDCQQEGSSRVQAPVQTQGGGSGDSQTPARAVFSVKALSARQLRALAAGRRVGVRVRVSRSGRVSARGVARIGRFRVRVMSASREADKAGLVKLGVRLSKAARRRLARHGSLAVRLAVRFEGARSASVRRLSLRTREAGNKPKLKVNRRAGSRAATIDGRAGK